MVVESIIMGILGNLAYDLLKKAGGKIKDTFLEYESRLKLESPEQDIVVQAVEAAQDAGVSGETEMIEFLNNRPDIKELTETIKKDGRVNNIQENFTLENSQNFQGNKNVKVVIKNSLEKPKKKKKKGKNKSPKS